MTWHVPVNFASTTVADGALNNTTSPVTFNVAVGAVFGSTFPVWAVVDPNGAQEVIEITGRSSNTLTATRASAAAHAGTPKIICAPSAEYIAEIQSAVDGKAPLASPALTGTPTAPTPTAGDNSTKIATTAYVDGAIAPKDAAILKATSAQSLTGGSFNKLTFGTVVYDNNSITGTSDQFTIQRAGVYVVELYVGFGGSDGNRLQIAISRNAAAYSNSGSGFVVTSSKVACNNGDFWATSCSGIVKCDVGDVLYAYAYASTGVSTSNASCADAPHVYFAMTQTV